VDRRKDRTKDTVTLRLTFQTSLQANKNKSMLLLLPKVEAERRNGQGKIRTSRKALTCRIVLLFLIAMHGIHRAEAFQPPNGGRQEDRRVATRCSQKLPGEESGKAPPMARIKQSMRYASKKKGEDPAKKTTKGETSVQPEKTAKSPAVVKNFRQAKGLVNIYRCAKTDDLGDLVNTDRKSLSRADRMLLFEAGLILDLRSPSERKEAQTQKWMEEAPGGKIEILSESNGELLVAGCSRAVLRLDVLGPKAFATYVEEAWLTSAQEKVQMILYKAIDADSLHNMRVDALNQRGLFGLNELILEAGKADLGRALKATTLHLEKKSSNEKVPVVIHCQQGKDRTGMLVMLMQSIMGVEDEAIISDYQASEAAIFSSKVEQAPPKPGKLDRAKMQRASKEVMGQTLQYIRKMYGSVSPGYLQAAGFDDSWRIRLVTALLIHMEKPVDKRRSKSRL
jgi:hypothetical protein